MDSALYNRDILRLATTLIANDRLPVADGTAEVRSPICGSRIQADITTNADSRITGLALRANACALGQASAAILRKNAVGEPVEMIAMLRDGIFKALNSQDDMPSVWAELKLLSSARDYPARHAAILLPYDAVIAAAQKTKVES
jgi:NifU-like protein involved in Fe-S cluster formation